MKTIFYLTLIISLAEITRNSIHSLYIFITLPSLVTGSFLLIKSEYKQI